MNRYNEKVFNKFTIKDLSNKVTLNSIKRRLEHGDNLKHIDTFTRLTNAVPYQAIHKVYQDIKGLNK